MSVGQSAAATIHTVVNSYKRAKVDTSRYLADVLLRVGTHPASRVADLVPANWKRIFGGGSTHAA